MKKTTLLVLLILGVSFSALFALTHRVIVGAGGGRSFSPQNIPAASVGDTIRWVWESGIHNTVSTTIPSGAASWNAPIDVSDTVFSYVITVPGVYNYVCTFHAAMGMTGSFTASTTYSGNSGKTVNSFKLEQNFPNPFNPSTKIRFSLPELSRVMLTVYDLSGRQVATLLNDRLQEGNYEFDFNAAYLSSGIYIYSLNTEKYRDMKRMVLLK